MSTLNVNGQVRTHNAEADTQSCGCCANNSA